jgi:hypothetical protein
MKWPKLAYNLILRGPNKKWMEKKKHCEQRVHNVLWGNP